MGTAAWIVMLLSIAALWGTTAWAMRRSLRLEDRKLKLIERQGEIDSYSPQALAELKRWIEDHPADEYTVEAKRRYNECVDVLQRIEHTFYDWDRAEIQHLHRL